MTKELSNKCIELLVELNKAVGHNITAKSLVLELGYIIKQDIDTDKNREEMLNGNAEKLYKENQQLICDNLRLKDILSSKIPAIENAFNSIGDRYDSINSMMVEIREFQKTL